jgi:hypothetical protein
LYAWRQDATAVLWRQLFAVEIELGLANMSWVDSLKRFVGERKRIALSITVSENGFLFVSSNGLSAQVQWSEIVEIRAFKLDLLAWHEVRLLFVRQSSCGFERAVRI